MLWIIAYLVVGIIAAVIASVRHMRGRPESYWDYFGISFWGFVCLFGWPFVVLIMTIITIAKLTIRILDGEE